MHAGPSGTRRSRPRRQLDYGSSTTFTVSLEGITDTQAARFHEFRTTNRCRAPAAHNFYNAILPHVCNEQSAQKVVILNTRPLPGAASASQLLWTVL